MEVKLLSIAVVIAHYFFMCLGAKSDKTAKRDESYAEPTVADYNFLMKDRPYSLGIEGGKDIFSFILSKENEIALENEYEKQSDSNERENESSQGEDKSSPNNEKQGDELVKSRETENAGFGTSNSGHLGFKTSGENKHYSYKSSILPFKSSILPYKSSILPFKSLVIINNYIFPKKHKKKQKLTRGSNLHGLFLPPLLQTNGDGSTDTSRAHDPEMDIGAHKEEHDSPPDIAPTLRMNDGPARVFQEAESDDRSVKELLESFQKDDMNENVMHHGKHGDFKVMNTTGDPSF